MAQKLKTPTFRMSSWNVQPHYYYEKSRKSYTNPFAKLADKYKDQSKRELIAVCLRFMVGWLRRGLLDLLTWLICLQSGYQGRSWKYWNHWSWIHLSAWDFVLMVHQWCRETVTSCLTSHLNFTSCKKGKGLVLLSCHKCWCWKFIVYLSLSIHLYI